MSRTIRRKGMKYPWNRRSIEDFNEKLEKYHEGEWRAERSFFDYWKCEWKTAAGRWYDKEVAEHPSYDHYIIYETARWHGDHGFGSYTSGAPRYIRDMLNRSFRARHKEQLVHAIQNGTEEDLLLERFTRDAGWWW